jgi:hypothetical protein
VSWVEPANNGDAVKKYHLDVYQDGAKNRTLEVTGTSQTIQDLSTEASYTFAVAAENKAGRSPVSDRSAAVVPYGTPTSPGTPTASNGNPTSGRADVRWSGIASGDFRGPGHRYEVRENGAAPRNAGTATSYSFTGLSDGTAYTFQARACNEYTCSEWTAGSNPVTPYTTPGAPAVSAERIDARTVRFTVRPGGTGGNPIDQLRYRVNGGGWQTMAAAGGSFDAGGAYSTAYQVEAQAHNRAGWGTTGSGSGTTLPDPANATVSISVGGAFGGGPSCTNGSWCKWLNLQVSGWEPNTVFHYRCLSTQHNSAGQVYFPRWEMGQWWGEVAGVPTRTDANGNWSGRTDCMHQYPDKYTWLETQEGNLANSNRIYWSRANVNP